MAKTELFRVLKSADRAERASQDISVTQLELMATNLLTVIERRKDRELAEQQEAQRKAEAIEALRERMEKECKELGLDIADVASQVTSPAKSKTPKAAAKYEITDSKGSRITWSGKGRKPAAFVEAIDKGIDLESLLISTENQ